MSLRAGLQERDVTTVVSMVLHCPVSLPSFAYSGEASLAMPDKASLRTSSGKASCQCRTKRITDLEDEHRGRI
jgi:hypothetical protein